MRSGDELLVPILFSLLIAAREGRWVASSWPLTSTLPAPESPLLAIYDGSVIECYGCGAPCNPFVGLCEECISEDATLWEREFDEPRRPWVDVQVRDGLL